MKSNNKDRDYIPILDQPIEELKKPIGKPVNFDTVMEKVLKFSPEKSGISPEKNK